MHLPSFLLSVRMAPHRNIRKKPIRRLSSPLLPAAVFPSIQSRQGARNAKLREAAEEVERATLNEQVYMLREEAGESLNLRSLAVSYVSSAASPNNRVKFKEYRFKRESPSSLHVHLSPLIAT